MKLHQIYANTPAMIRRVGREIYQVYATKELRTYFAEQFTPLNRGDQFQMFTNIKMSGRNKVVTLPSNDYSRVISDDGKFEMIVPNKFVDMYVNVGE